MILQSWGEADCRYWAPGSARVSIPDHGEKWIDECVFH